MVATKIMVPCVSGVECHFDWAAISALGGWVAALATFVAVIVPYWRGRQEQSARAKLVLGEFVPRLAVIVDVAGHGIEAMKMYSLAGVRADFRPGPIVRISVDLPVLEVTPERIQVIVALNALRQHLDRWNRVADAFEAPVATITPGGLKAYVTLLEIEQGELIKSSAKVAREILAVCPEERERLAKVINRAEQR